MINKNCFAFLEVGRYLFLASKRYHSPWREASLQKSRKLDQAPFAADVMLNINVENKIAISIEF